MSKEEKLRAFEILENLDSFWDNSKEKIFNAVTVLTEYTNYLEDRLASTEAVHEYDVKMIDEVKGENIKLNKMINEMAKMLEELKLADLKRDKNGDYHCYNKNEWIEYFEKEVEKEVNES